MINSAILGTGQVGQLQKTHQSLFGMSESCSLSRRLTHWFLGVLIRFSRTPERGKCHLEFFQEETRAVKAVLHLTERTEKDDDAHLTSVDFYLDFLVISQPQI